MAVRMGKETLLETGSHHYIAWNSPYRPGSTSQDFMSSLSSARIDGMHYLAPIPLLVSFLSSFSPCDNNMF